jgi:hypothetical protein
MVLLKRTNHSTKELYEFFSFFYIDMNRLTLACAGEWTGVKFVILVLENLQLI